MGKRQRHRRGHLCSSTTSAGALAAAGRDLGGVYQSRHHQAGTPHACFAVAGRLPTGHLSCGKRAFGLRRQAQRGRHWQGVVIQWQP